ncbi:MAG TPA: tRNA (adenosine(37)-N6)-dimethylallyltransferase MiaA [Candidatus Limnocylindrales bacterium]|nr:tRNA (adenosine(37)-N6)-dimethylallyltransferase MiaA [Candidatus Limnocylindrales bacterium]
MTAPPLLVIAGPTATGKTGLSIKVARRLRADGIAAEIISADSRQVYRGLDIGTAKVSVGERGGVPHHGLDLVEPDQPYSVADYVRDARGALGGIAERGGLAILVGGTGLYLRAIVRGLDPEALPSDPEARRRINATIEATGVDAAADRLRTLAPLRAARVDLRNPRRVARALEVAELIGDEPLPPERPYDGPIGWVGLTLDAATHAAWIGRRARSQFEAGLLDEARALRERFDPTLPAFSAIGYREAWAVLDGQLDLEAAIELDARRNRQFAKRQATWFRREPGMTWLDAETDQVPTLLELGRRLASSAAAVKA